MAEKRWKIDPGEKEKSVEELLEEAEAEIFAPVEDDAIRKAKEALYAALAKYEKVRCPVCDKIAQRQLSTIGRHGAAGLISLITRHHNGEFKDQPVKLRYFHTGRTAIAESRHWGMVLQVHRGWGPRGTWRIPKKKKEDGYYLPLPKSIAWIKGEITIPNIVVKYNQEVLGFEGPEVKASQFFMHERDYENGLKCMEGKRDLNKWRIEIGLPPILDVGDKPYIPRRKNPPLPTE